MLKWVNGLFDRIFVAAGAFFFSQVPHFFQHYTQRLGGHLAELQLQMTAMQKIAEKSGKSLQEYAQKFLSQPDADFVSQGEMIREMMTRHTTLSEAYSALLNASPFSRLVIFLEHVHMDIAWMTLKNFTLGLTFSIEGGIYALLGIGFGYLVYWIVRQIFVGCWKWVKSLFSWPLRKQSS